MVSNSSSSTVTDGIQRTEEKNTKSKELPLAKHIGTDYSYKHTIVWKNAIAFLALHLLGLWGIFIMLSGNRPVTLPLLGIGLFSPFLERRIGAKTYHAAPMRIGIFVGYVSTEGVTIGAHRLYAHRSFKATPVLRALLIIFQTMAGQNCVFIWCRDHRLHHRYSDTDGDPHNSKRGFFFCHIGWLMTKKHPLVIELGRKINMTDLKNDWMVMFQKKYFYYIYAVFSILIPVAVPYYCFGETFWNSLLSSYFFRYMLQLNGTWLVNSAAHLYGTRPYDKNLQPVESWFVSFISLGEGWHNYHHTYPWDYKAAELSELFNLSARIIKCLEKMGLACDLKTASPDMVRGRILKTGDGTHYALGNEQAKKAVTAIGILHPFNPSYNVAYKMGKTVLEEKGLPLYHENDVLDTPGKTTTAKSA